jgi:NADPH-dependent 2,4-dienoyl-CoA reductase/sulfur reductase-like enzyme
MGAQRLVVIGGDAAGMSAASQARKRRGPDELAIVAFERGRYTSYSACGIPYWISGAVEDMDKLVSRTPEKHRDNGIDMRTRTEVVGIDVAARTVRARDLNTGREYDEPYDDLVYATGSVPARPPVPGIDAAGVYGVQTLDDGAALRAELDGGHVQHVVIVGGGYIGLEVAEACQVRGLDVTVVDRSATPVGTFDPDVGEFIADAVRDMGVKLVMSDGVAEIETGADGQAVAVHTASGRRLPADLVVLGLGVRPNVALAREAGIPLGPSGGIAVDHRMRTQAEGVWAAGDCVESIHRLSGQRVVVALGTHANKQGRVAGINLGGGYATFPGVIGTAITKICSLEVARTGLSEREADQAGYRFVTAVVDSTTKAGYFPGAAQIRLKLIAEQRTGRLLGAQIVGREDAAKRIDVLATAIWNEMDVDEVLSLDLSYAPPFSPVWDPVLIAARKAFDAVDAGARSPDDQPG